MLNIINYKLFSTNIKATLATATIRSRNLISLNVRIRAIVAYIHERVRNALQDFSCKQFRILQTYFR